MVVDLALFAAGLALGLVLMFVFLRREKSLFNERIKERDLREARCSVRRTTPWP